MTPYVWIWAAIGRSWQVTGRSCCTTSFTNCGRLAQLYSSTSTFEKWSQGRRVAVSGTEQLNVNTALLHTVPIHNEQAAVDVTSRCTHSPSTEHKTPTAEYGHWVTYGPWGRKLNANTFCRIPASSFIHTRISTRTRNWLLTWWNQQPVEPTEVSSTQLNSTQVYLKAVAERLKRYKAV